MSTFARWRRKFFQRPEAMIYHETLRCLLVDRLNCDKPLKKRYRTLRHLILKLTNNDVSISVLKLEGIPEGKCYFYFSYQLHFINLSFKFYCVIKSNFSIYTEID